MEGSRAVQRFGVKNGLKRSGAVCPYYAAASRISCRFQ